VEWGILIMRVALLFGGRSGEHEISVMSAGSIFSALLQGGFDIVPLGITRDGHWVYLQQPEVFFRQGHTEVTQELGPSCYILPDPLRPGIWINGAAKGSIGNGWNEANGMNRTNDSIKAHGANAPDKGPGASDLIKTHGADDSNKGHIPNDPSKECVANKRARPVCDCTVDHVRMHCGQRTARSGHGSRVDVDVVFPVLHGLFGEDGTIQGLLDLSGMPYVGPGTLASAVCMDKDTTKMVLARHGVPYVPSLTVERWMWREKREAVLERLLSGISLPVFVKPSGSGSSLGVYKVKDSSNLSMALDNAFLYDIKVLIEPSQEGCMEVECAVLGNVEPKASVAGQILPSREFYDYEAKYMDEGTRLIIPAPLSDKLMGKVRKLAVAAFMATGCSGLARVDFFVNPDTGDVYVNELNTMPGFTKVSMYPKLWEASGVPYTELVRNLIDLALDRKKSTERHVHRILEL
jgi:D-alanine-D-alanine ligase